MVRPGKVAATPPGPRRRPSVLVVDDYPATLEWMTRRLRLAEIAVHPALSGEEAVSIALRERLDLALIDYRLPGIDGVETAAAIWKSGVRLPWILFSGVQDYHAAFKAGQHGALDVVWIPFDVYAVARRALDALASGPSVDWSRLVQGSRLPEPGTTIACAAWWILRACASADDLPRLAQWGDFINVSYSPLRGAFTRIDIEPHDARDFMRILRALAHTGGRAEHVEGQLALGDPRTTRAMLDKAGLPQTRPSGPITFENFVQSQHFVPFDHPLLAALRSLVAQL